MSEVKVTGSVTELFCLQQQERIEQLTRDTVDLLQKHEELKSRVIALEKQGHSLQPLTATAAVRDCLCAAYAAEEGDRPFFGSLIYAPRVGQERTDVRFDDYGFFTIENNTSRSAQKPGMVYYAWCGHADDMETASAHKSFLPSTASHLPEGEYTRSEAEGFAALLAKSCKDWVLVEVSGDDIQWSMKGFQMKSGYF